MDNTRARIDSVFEPFRIKMIEPIKPTTRQEREHIILEADYNLFRVRSEDVLIDLLTDSGTGAMSINAWAALMRGDESYAGAKSWFHFEETVKRVFGFRHIIPVHQGRAAERILFGHFVQPGMYLPSNTHFDTTRANIEVLGGHAVDLPCVESQATDHIAPFKGNMDIDALQRLLDEKGTERVPLIMLTITNNARGGQPVSMANIRAVSELANRHGIPFYCDACRFAENAWFIKTREPGYTDRSTRDIVREMFSLTQGCTMSAKKDGLSNIGGFLCTRDEDLKQRMVIDLLVTEGFPTYGGLAGRDLEAIAIGLEEALDESYLNYRVQSVAYLANRLQSFGVPVLLPPGGHAVYVDARRFLPHIPSLQYPAQVLAVELYIEAGVRATEIGSVMYGFDSHTGEEKPAKLELLRLALPRRTYTSSHLDHVAEALGRVWDRRTSMCGLQIVEAGRYLRHFSAKFAPIVQASTPVSRAM